jgi:hypothetical protein
LWDLSSSPEDLRFTPSELPDSWLCDRELFEGGGGTSKCAAGGAKEIADILLRARERVVSGVGGTGLLDRLRGRLDCWGTTRVVIVPAGVSCEFWGVAATTCTVGAGGGAAGKVWVITGAGMTSVAVGEEGAGSEAVAGGGPSIMAAGVGDATEVVAGGVSVTAANPVVAGGGSVTAA